MTHSIISLGQRTASSALLHRASCPEEQLVRLNVTRAGIHADGLLKNEEIYNIFDTGKFLNRPPLVAVSNTSGLAGIALWINTYYRLPDDRKVDKNSKLVTMIKEWVDEQYDEGRVTTITDNELVVQITDCCKKLNIVL